MSKYIVTLKFFGYLFPNKNYNEKATLFHPWLTVFCTFKVIHVYAQVFNYNVDMQLFIYSMLSCKNSMLQ